MIAVDLKAENVEQDAVRGAGKRAFIAGAMVSGNLPDNWRQAAEVGIDGILTDFPLELRTKSLCLTASRS